MKKGLVLLLLILLLGAFLRVRTITVKELWYDEAFSAEIIKNSYSEVFRLATFDVHPPLYYFVLKLSSSLLGHSELALRLPSVLFGIALIVLVYYLTLYIKFDQNRALFAALVMATNPFLVSYSREARSYAMLAFLMVLAFLLLIKALRDKTYIPVTFALILLFLTHYISVFFILVCAVILLFHSKKTLLYLLPLVALIALWIPTIVSSSHSTGLTWVPRFTWMRAPQSVQAFILGTNTNQSGLHLPLNPFPLDPAVAAVLLSAILLVYAAFTKPSTEAKHLLICGAIPIALVAWTSMFLDINLYVERYMTGYAAFILVYFSLYFPKPVFALPYVGLCIYLILSFKPISIGFRELANFQSTKPLVMVSATDYITAKYYIPNIKLQEGDWNEWVILDKEDVFTKQKPGSSYYLVNRGPLEDWKPNMIVGSFYLYDWKY